MKVQEKEASHFVRLRGLPYAATEAEIREFFDEIPVVDVQFTYTSSGRASGECYVEFDNEYDVANALKKNNNLIQSRYIEAFTVGEVEFEGIMRRAEVKKSTENVGFIRVRGVPYNCKDEDIVGFFKGINVEEVIFGKEPWVGGRPSGEAFVKFVTKGDADRALELNGKHMGTRYLELFRIDGDAYGAFKRKMNNEPIPLKNVQFYSDPRTNYRTFGYGGGYGYEYDSRRYGGYGGSDSYGPPRGRKGGYQPFRGRGGGYGELPRYSPYVYPGGYGDGYGYGSGIAPDKEPLPTRVHMRGIPFNVTSDQVREFFAPLVPIDVRTGLYENGRSTGDGWAEFSTIEEAKQALQKDRQHIGSRYIELFPGSSMRLFSDANYNSIMPAKPSLSDAMNLYSYIGITPRPTTPASTAQAMAASTNTRNPYADFCTSATGSTKSLSAYDWPSY